MGPSFRFFAKSPLMEQEAREYRLPILENAAGVTRRVRRIGGRTIVLGTEPMANLMTSWSLVPRRRSPSRAFSAKGRGAVRASHFPRTRRELLLRRSKGPLRQTRAELSFYGAHRTPKCSSTLCWHLSLKVLREVRASAGSADGRMRRRQCSLRQKCTVRHGLDERTRVTALGRSKAPSRLS